MPRKGENIYKRKDGRWEARYINRYENGKAKYRSVYGHTYMEAKIKRVEEQSKPNHPKQQYRLTEKGITIKQLLVKPPNLS